MSAWTVEDEEKYILEVLKRYDPKVVSLVERCHHARLYPIGDHVRPAFTSHIAVYSAAIAVIPPFSHPLDIILLVLFSDTVFYLICFSSPLAAIFNSSSMATLPSIRTNCSRKDLCLS